jgi:hypothetical protein
MSIVQWQELVGSAPSLHMLVAFVPPSEDEGSSARTLQMLVRRLLTTLSLAGRYAVAVSRAQGRLEIICAFELWADAKRAAQAVDATAMAPRADWASLHSFLLDEAAMARLLRIAGHGRPRRPRVVRE